MHEQELENERTRHGFLCTTNPSSDLYMDCLLKDGKVATKEKTSEAKQHRTQVHYEIQHAHRTDTKTHRHKDENMHTRRLIKRQEPQEREHTTDEVFICGPFTKKTTRLRLKTTSEANQHRTQVPYSTHTEQARRRVEEREVYVLKVGSYGLSADCTNCVYTAG